MKRETAEQKVRLQNDREWRAKLDHVKRERDALREALIGLLPLVRPYGYGVTEREVLRQAIKAARAALEDKP